MSLNRIVLDKESNSSQHTYFQAVSLSFLLIVIDRAQELINTHQNPMQ
jgi:hypothetical protein